MAKIKKPLIYGSGFHQHNYGTVKTVISVPTVTTTPWYPISIFFWQYLLRRDSPPKGWLTRVDLLCS